MTPRPFARAPLALFELLALLGAALALATTAGAAGLTTQRTFGMPGRPSLRLDAPLRWLDAVEWSRDGERVKVRLWDGDAVAVALSPVWDDGSAGAAFSAPERVRAVVEQSARAVLDVPPGTSLDLQEVAGRDGAGYLFTVTDEAVPDPPPPGSFAVMTQGALPVGQSLVTVTILTHRGSGSELLEALAVLRSVQATDEAGDAWRRPSEPPDPRERRGAFYELTPPRGFVVETEAPLRLLHSATGATLTVSVMDGTDWRESLRDVRRQLELQLGEGFRMRRQGPLALAGVEGGELLHVEERSDAEVHLVVLPVQGALLHLTWRAPSPRVREAARAERDVLAALRLIAP